MSRRILKQLLSKVDLTSCLQPIFLWMQMVGIPSGEYHSSSRYRRYPILVVGIALMTWVVTANSYKLLQVPDRSGGGSTRQWTWALKTFQTHSAHIVISLNLFIGAHLQWRHLWHKACQIEQIMSFNADFYRALRKISTAAISLLLLVHSPIEILEKYVITNDYYYQESAALVYRCCSDDFEKTNALAVAMQLGYWLGTLYPVSAVVLFMSLTWMASMMLQRLVDDLPTAAIPVHYELNEQLVTWKRHYRLISDFIERINHLFGAILLTYIASQIFNYVTYIFWLILEFKHKKSAVLQLQESKELQTLLMVYLVRNGAYVFSLIMVSHRIKQKVCPLCLCRHEINSQMANVSHTPQVLKASRLLRTLQFSDNTVQCQVHF